MLVDIKCCYSDCQYKPVLGNIELNNINDYTGDQSYGLLCNDCRIINDQFNVRINKEIKINCSSISSYIFIPKRKDKYFLLQKVLIEAKSSITSIEISIENIVENTPIGPLSNGDIVILTDIIKRVNCSSNILVNINKEEEESNINLIIIGDYI